MELEIKELKSSETENIIYYFSEHCEYCVKLSGMIKTNADLSKDTTWEDISKFNKNTIPENIKAVPTIVFQNKVYAGKDAFDWVKERLG